MMLLNSGRCSTCGSWGRHPSSFIDQSWSPQHSSSRLSQDKVKEKIVWEPGSMAGPLHFRSGQKVCRRERQLKHIVCVIVLAFNQEVEYHYQLCWVSKLSIFRASKCIYFTSVWSCCHQFYFAGASVLMLLVICLNGGMRAQILIDFVSI